MRPKKLDLHLQSHDLKTQNPNMVRFLFVKLKKKIVFKILRDLLLKSEDVGDAAINRITHARESLVGDSDRSCASLM